MNRMDILEICFQFWYYLFWFFFKIYQSVFAEYYKSRAKESGFIVHKTFYIKIKL